ncbi:restriction endonuclease subunit S [Brachyspira pulli]|uniref:restriction endonuclease subunit S n=1 Tax=Brachyspira pulli TaxID=310721 RepID=UPI0026322611|nr:restriction endonuclease subunit S [uncultured Brachyspira sp.]
MKRIEELFYIKYGNSLSLQDCELSTNGIPFISRGAKNNGVTARVKLLNNIKLNKPNTISVAVSGSVLEAFLQKEPYYTGYHIFILEPKLRLSDIEMLFYCMCIRANKYKYNYGRQANRTLKNLIVPDTKDIPSYIYNYKLEFPNNNPILKDNNFIINTNFWNNFIYSDIFRKPTRGKLVSIKDFNIGKMPVVTSTEDNNGINDYLDIPDFLLEEENTITIANNGSVGATFYQEKKYAATSDVTIMKLKDKNVKLNKYIALFLVTVISKEKYRFNYGRKWGITRMEKTTIKLPAKFINDKYEPDWEYMENYIKSLPYSSSI